MARFDLYARPEASGFLLDCQAELLCDLNTRLVVPLLPAAEAPRPASRLNPTFEVEGLAVVMVTQFAAAIPARELRTRMGSLANRQEEILNALDVLISGV